MAKNYFIYNHNNDPEKMYRSVILWFKEKQYEVQGVEKDFHYLIQARKTGTIRTLLGTNLAFTVKIYTGQDSVSNQRELIVETSRGRWIQNIAGAAFSALFTGGLTVWTGIAGAGWGLVLENELISYLENDLKYRRIQANITKNNGDTPSTNNNNVVKNPELKKVISDLEAEINKLEIAFTDGILTEQEFLRKKAILEKQIDDYEVNFILEEKLQKLQDAFSQGILDDYEYEQKLHELESNMRDKIIQEKRLQRNKHKINKLKEALENGIITKEEYQAKIANL